MNREEFQEDELEEGRKSLLIVWAMFFPVLGLLGLFLAWAWGWI